MYSGLTQNSNNSRARAIALGSLQQLENESIDVVQYRSSGLVAIITQDSAAALDIAAGLNADCRSIIIQADEADSDAARTTQHDGIVHVKPRRVSGYLGAFHIIVDTAQGEAGLGSLLGQPDLQIDLVLDLTSPPYIASALSPPGYFSAEADSASLRQALMQIPELIGEFEKPRYFSYKPNICVHGNSGLTGCRNCIEACPAEAIVSLKDRIEVNPWLCQGEGICATVCPSGALTFTKPPADELHDNIRLLLKTYRNEGGINPVVLFHDAEAGRILTDRLSARLPETVLPVQLESPAAAGMDTWLATLAYGAGCVAVLITNESRASVRTQLQHQLGIAHALLTGMGYLSDHLRLLAESDGDENIINALRNSTGLIQEHPASFTTANEKRNTLRMAIDTLYSQAKTAVDIQPLPEGAPFGEVIVDRESCTLCMACVSVCPASALIDNKETPKLSFIEWNCTQCGLCETACPEDAISLVARFIYDSEQREKRQILNEEAPFCCIRCGKPFATQSLIDMMTEKLKGHRMFKGEQALMRLQMCEDCRVIDSYTSV